MIAKLLMIMLSFVLTISQARADTTVTVCGKDVWPGDPRIDLSEALQIGGRITFACSGVIEITKSHGLHKDLQVDGEHKITLDGKGRRIFGLGTSGVHVSFTHIKIQGGGLPPGSNPGSLIVGEGVVSLLEGTTVKNSDRPIWLMAGDLQIHNASISENIGPVLVVSDGTLTITQNSRLTGNKGDLLHTGPRTKVHISDSHFLDNGHSIFGTDPADCEVVIAKSWFADNTASDDTHVKDGGAILSRCRLTIEDTQFERNHAGLDGGAVYLAHGVSASMRKVLFKQNRARGGGAIVHAGDGVGQEQRGSLSLRNGRFENNEASMAGGALLVSQSNVVEISGSAFIGNSAEVSAGAIFVDRSLLNIHGSLFRKNRAPSGATIQGKCMSAIGRISNAIITDNISATTGGAYYGSNMRFINTTVVNNGSLPIQHGDLCGESTTIEFANTILQGGWNGACGGGDTRRTFSDLGHNLQFPWQTCGTSIPVAYPLLGPFYAPLMPMSPAGSSGDNTLCMAPPISGRDIFGTHRPQGGTCSIGAVEGDLTTLIERLVKRRRGNDPR